MIRGIDSSFEGNTFSFKSLFSDTQRRILDRILDSTLKEAERSYRELYRHHAPLMRFMSELALPLPDAFRTTAQYVLNTDLRRTLARDLVDLDRVRELLDEVHAAKVELDAKGLSYAFEQTLVRLAHQLAATPADLGVLQTLDSTASVARTMPLEVDVWQVQNTFFALLQKHYPKYAAEAANDEQAKQWARTFEHLGEQLSVSVKKVDA
ncbi:MAG TPA: hypothetical protein VM100_05895 [Longimicrobiales bacterium]|nr:hypothetical protein [Longimicrobiales bacterium]